MKHIKIINKDLVVAYDTFSNIFQHAMICGLPTGGMLADWVLEKPSERGFLCNPYICDLFKSLDHLNESNIFPDYSWHKIWARSMTFAFNEWKKENLTWESYPVESYFVVLVKLIISTHRFNVCIFQ